MSSLVKFSAMSAVVLSMAVSAHAQDFRPQNIGYGEANQSASDNFDVRKRDRPEYAARGVRMGSFVAYPALDIEMLSNDNIGATPNADKSDIATVISPEFLIKSDFNNHAVQARLYGEMGRFFDETDENFENYGAEVDGRFDVTRDFKVVFGAEHGILNEERVSSLANALTIEPIEYTKSSGYIGFNKSFNRLSIQTSADVTRYNYDDAVEVGGGRSEQDGRDLNILSGDIRADYEVTPAYSVFTKGTASRRRYKIDGDDGIRDSDGFRGTAGVSAELTNLIVGEAEVGYERRNYVGFEDVDTVVFGAALNWYPTPLLTARLSVNRNIVDGVDEISTRPVSGIVVTRYGAKLDYEALRNVIITPSIQYVEGNYQESSDNEDSIITGISADYMINNHFSLRGSYEYSTRDSSISALNYDRNLIRFGLRSKI